MGATNGCLRSARAGGDDFYLNMTEAEIRVLLSKLREPDQRAFEALYRAFASRVEGFVLHAMSRPDEALAEEVVVDTFFAVWRAPDRFNGRSRFSTWLLGIARNQLLSRLRAERRWSSHENLDDLPEQADESADPLEHVEQRQRAEALAHCADRLNPNQRSALYLMHVEGMSQGEVAEVMAIRRNTVKSRVREAIKAILPCVERFLKREGVTIPTRTGVKR